MKEEDADSTFNKILQNSIYGAHISKSADHSLTIYRNDYEKLHDEISPLCLPDQADKVIVKVLGILKGYEANDTHRNLTDFLMQISRKHVGL